jgi:hypothetical protein
VRERLELSLRPHLGLTVYKTAFLPIGRPHQILIFKGRRNGIQPRMSGHHVICNYNDPKRYGAYFLAGLQGFAPCTLVLETNVITDFTKDPYSFLELNVGIEPTTQPYGGHIFPTKLIEHNILVPRVGNAPTGPIRIPVLRTGRSL